MFPEPLFWGFKLKQSAGPDFSGQRLGGSDFRNPWHSKCGTLAISGAFPPSSAPKFHKTTTLKEFEKEFLSPEAKGPNFIVVFLPPLKTPQSWGFWDGASGSTALVSLWLDFGRECGRFRLSRPRTTAGGRCRKCRSECFGVFFREGGADRESAGRKCGAKHAET